MLMCLAYVSELFVAIANLTSMPEQAPLQTPCRLLTVPTLRTGRRPRIFKDISLIVPSDDPDAKPKIRTLRRVTEESFGRFAHNLGAVAVMVSGDMYTPDMVQLQDGLTCTAIKADQPSIDRRVSLLYVKMPKALSPFWFTNLFLHS